jgi:KipI family sensor histidine kinase inhibitor
MIGAHQIVPAGDSAVILELEDRIDPLINQQAVAIAGALENMRVPGVRDVVPTFRSVAVYFDPLKTDVDGLMRRLDEQARQPPQTFAEERPLISIPVCYGGAHGPDLPAIAARAGVDQTEAIALHAAETYRVFMLGFLPGFAYMGLVNPQIAAPRHASPRLRVPAGSVGIAGRQTGIYPLESPGGWQLIGRTPLRTYDPVVKPPFLLKAGDRVKFEPIDAAQYKAWPRCV